MKNQILDIAYSDIGLAPWNTMEHYYLASKLGFNAIKGDVRVTKDGKLVMCHDPGFTLGENGKIIDFNSNRYTPISELSFAECMELEHEAFSKTFGYGAKVASFEGLVSICKKENKICYVTVRDEFLDVLVEETLRILKEYDMLENCIINSFTMETLKRFREANLEVMLSQVQPPMEVLTRETVDRVAELKNSMICMFSFDPYSYEQPVYSYESIDESLETIKYAKQQGIPLYQAQVYDLKDRERLLHYGFTGFQIIKPIFPKFE